MDMGLKNKVALVLASSKGLGFVCAKGFMKRVQILLFVVGLNKI